MRDYTAISFAYHSKVQRATRRFLWDTAVTLLMGLHGHTSQQSAPICLCPALSSVTNAYHTAATERKLSSGLFGFFFLTSNHVSFWFRKEKKDKAPNSRVNNLHFLQLTGDTGGLKIPHWRIVRCSSHVCHSFSSRNDDAILAQMVPI